MSVLLNTQKRKRRLQSGIQSLREHKKSRTHIYTHRIRIIVCNRSSHLNAWFGRAIIIIQPDALHRAKIWGKGEKENDQYFQLKAKLHEKLFSLQRNKQKNQKQKIDVEQMIEKTHFRNLLDRTFFFFLSYLHWKCSAQWCWNEVLLVLSANWNAISSYLHLFFQNCCENSLVKQQPEPYFHYVIIFCLEDSGPEAAGWDKTLFCSIFPSIRYFLQQQQAIKSWYGFSHETSGLFFYFNGSK